MSPPARALLALAAAALLRAACAAKCTTVKGGIDGDIRLPAINFHLDQTNSVTDLPNDVCPYHPFWPTHEVGVVVTACDPYGAAPQVQLLDGNSRVHIACTWTDGQLCPQGIDVSVEEMCQYY